MSSSSSNFVEEDETCRISISEKLVDEIDTLGKNYYDTENKKASLFVSMIENDEDATLKILQFELENLHSDISLEQFCSLVSNNPMSLYNPKDCLFACRINISDHKNKPLFKVFDKNCFLINDILSKNDEKKSKVYLLSYKNSDIEVKQTNGILLNPIKKYSKTPADNSGETDTAAKEAVESVEALVPGRVPTINTINKLIAPNITVLVVEDNPINCKILSKILKRHRINYKLAKNGLEAIQMYCLRRS